jgi:protein-S-isoprenylcysteine O-methyltransferase Ste14
MSIFYLTYLLWISSEVILSRIARIGKSESKSADKNSNLIIWIAIILSVFIGVTITFAFELPVSGNSWFAQTGILIIFCGIFIRFTAIRQLGRFFTVTVLIRKDHQLIQNGFYKFLRHPSYTGALISFLGFGISINNWLALPVVILIPLSAFIHRINVEEKVLLKEFGTQYEEYAKRTKRLIPFVY